MEVTDKPKTYQYRRGGRCRLADAPVAVPARSARWLFHRAAETDRLEIADFQSWGVALAGDSGIAIDVCIGDPGKTDEAMQTHAWIARETGRIVGLLWIAVSRSQVAHIAGMCVDPRLRGSRLPVDLLSYALRFCRDTGILKVVLSTHLPEQEAWALFGKCGYDISRQRRRGQRHVMDFYLNLYKRPDCESSPSGMHRLHEEGQCSDIQPYRREVKDGHEPE